MVIMQSKRHLLIGSGQSAFHLNEYLKLLSSIDNSIVVTHWSRKTHSESDLSVKIQNADCVYLLIKDDSLIEFYNRHPSLKEKPCFHFSGALASFGNCISVHPLMSFASHKPLALDLYKSIPFVTDHSQRPKDFLLPNSVQMVSPEDKKLYHALCVISGNFTVLLWTMVQKQFTKMNLPPEILNPYLNQIAKQLMEDPEKSLSGPFLRKDFKTIEAHLESIHSTPLEPIYLGFLKSYFTEKDLAQILPLNRFEKNEALC